MLTKYSLGVLDYIVICSTLLITVGIGIASRFYGGKQKTTKEYMLAGKGMSIAPVVFSIVVTLTSASTMISTPAEVYKYGFKYVMFVVPIPFGMFLASVVFIPVYFQCGVSSVYEFLEMRYGKIIKTVITTLFLLQMVFYMSVALFGCVLALSSVTDLSLELSIISLGAICTFYCVLGGLRAVLWTDMFQALLMIICVTSIYIAGIRDNGGVEAIYNKAKEGQRLQMFDMKFDFTRRFGFWACTCRGFSLGFGFYGTNQLEVQRVLSLSNVKRAKLAFRLSSIPMLLMFGINCAVGVILYSTYHLCDPVLNKARTGLSKYDQLVPVFIISKFHSIPGMTGLCIAGIFSASMSTVSSALNSASTVTVVDFIQPLFKKKDISDARSVWLARILSFIYGFICIGISFCFMNVSSLKTLLYVLVVILEGPMTAIFLVGVTTRKASDKCVSVSVVLTFVIMASLSMGTLYSGYNEPPLPLSTSMCPSQNVAYNLSNASDNCFNSGNCSSSFKPLASNTEDTFILFRLSVLWYPVLGFILTMFFILLSVLLTGWRKNVIPADSKCLSPVTRFWIGQQDSASKDNSMELK